jgi:hypothetical protein
MSRSVFDDAPIHNEIMCVANSGFSLDVSPKYVSVCLYIDVN